MRWMDAISIALLQLSALCLSKDLPLPPNVFLCAPGMSLPRYAAARNAAKTLEVKGHRPGGRV